MGPRRWDAEDTKATLTKIKDILASMGPRRWDAEDSNNKIPIHVNNPASMGPRRWDAEDETQSLDHSIRVFGFNGAASLGRGRL